jgi:hypothetical protein
MKFSRENQEQSPQRLSELAQIFLTRSSSTTPRRSRSYCVTHLNNITHSLTPLTSANRKPKAIPVDQNNHHGIDIENFESLSYPGSKVSRVRSSRLQKSPNSQQFLRLKSRKKEIRAKNQKRLQIPMLSHLFPPPGAMCRHT